MAERPTVLLVDDDVEMVDSLKGFLEKNGYAVLTALDGEAALRVVRECRPDLILLDLMLPKLGGHKVLKLLKSDAHLSDIPVVVITARSMDEDLAVAARQQAQAFLVKPIDLNTVLNQISASLKPR